MTPTDLLRSLRARGFDLWRDLDGRAQVSPASKLTEADRAALAACRDELLPLLPRELTPEQQAAMDAFLPAWEGDDWQLVDVALVDVGGRLVAVDAVEHEDLLAVLRDYHAGLTARKQADRERQERRHAEKQKRVRRDAETGGLFKGGDREG